MQLLMRARWDALSDHQKTAEVMKMPQQCHRCGADSSGTNFTPDASVGYTKLLCSQCCVRELMFAGGRGRSGDNYDDGHDEDDYDETYRGAAPPGHPASSASSSERGSSSPWPVGSRVRITGLVAAPQHNGKVGTVCGALDVGTGRLAVALDDAGAKKLKIKASNLVAL